jgi:hypothetical protein
MNSGGAWSYINAPREHHSVYDGKRSICLIEAPRAAKMAERSHFNSEQERALMAYTSAAREMPFSQAGVN